MVLEKNICLIDYEVLIDDWGKCLIVFGKFVGMVGVYNGILMYGKCIGLFDLICMKDCFDYVEVC